jgi:hypothetical protein
VSRASGGDRRDQAEALIARELSSLAEGNAGTLPRGYANRVMERLRTEGVGIRRRDALRLIREYADYLQTPGTVVRHSPEQFTRARSATAQATKRGAALNVVALMRREGLSLAQAVRQHNREHPGARVSGESVRRLVPKALEKHGTRWQATSYDRYARTTDVLTTRGIRRVTVHDSRTASLIARHHLAVRTYLEGRADASILRPFQGKHFRVNKRAYVLETDLEMLERLAMGGEFDDLVIGSGQEMAA